MDEPELKVIIDGWIEYVRAAFSQDRSARIGSDALYGWANEWVETKIETDPDAAWEFVLAVLARSPDDEIACRLACGPFWVMIQMHPDVFAERIALETRRSPVFRDFLGWQLSIPEELEPYIGHMLPNRPRTPDLEKKEPKPKKHKSNRKKAPTIRRRGV